MTGLPSALSRAFKFQIVVDGDGIITEASAALRAAPFSIRDGDRFFDVFSCDLAPDPASLVERFRDEADLRLALHGCGIGFAGVALAESAGWRLLLSATHVPDHLSGASALTVSDFGPFDAARYTSFLKHLHIGMETDLLQSAEGLDAALHRCGELQERTRDVCAFIAHDIGNAVSIAFMSLDSIGTRSASDDALLDRINTAKRSLDSIRQMGKSLDTLTSMRSFPVDTIEIDDFLRDNDKLLEMAAGQNCKLVITSGAPGQCIRVDPAGLIHALINLIFNSREALAAQSHGSIVIGTELADTQDGSRIRISVIDNGPGVSAAIRDRIFEPSVSTKAGSNGLGLPSVRSFCASNGGSIEYHTSPEGYPRFELSFPVATKQEQIRVLEQKSGRPQVGGADILVVEDEPDALDLIVDVIDSLGHRAQGVKSIWQAIHVLDSSPFDLILIDASMARTAEVDLVQWIRLHAPRMKICEMSGSAGNFRRDALADLSALKPLSFDTIKDIVAKLIPDDTP